MSKKTDEKVETKKVDEQKVRNEKILGALLAIIVLLIVTMFASIYTFFFSGQYLIIKKSSLNVDELEEYVYTNLEEDYYEKNEDEENFYNDEEDEFKYTGAPVVTE